MLNLRNTQSRIKLIKQWWLAESNQEKGII
jgi:hypothetical protein